MDEEVLRRLDAIDRSLERLNLIESHLLDLLIPHRKAYTRSPVPEPPPVVAESLRTLMGHTTTLHAKLDALTARTLKEKHEMFEETHAAIETAPPAAEAPHA